MRPRLGRAFIAFSNCLEPENHKFLVARGVRQECPGFNVREAFTMEKPAALRIKLNVWTWVAHENSLRPCDHSTFSTSEMNWP